MSEYKMPRLGADMEDAILVEWKVKEGDRVQKGDIIAEIETVKGDIEVEVFEDGIIEKIVAQPGEQLPVGTVLAYINNNGKEAPEKPVEVPPIEEPAPSPIPEEVPPKKEPVPTPEPTEIPPREEPPIIIPTPGEPSEEEPVIPQEVPLLDEPAIKPLPVELPSVEEPEVPSIPEEMPTRRPPAPRIIPREKPSPDRPTFRHNASPLARKIAEDRGIDLTKVKGTGEGGIIHKMDVENYATSINKGMTKPSLREQSTIGAIQSTPLKNSPKVSRKDKMRTAIAAAMSRSNQEIPHYYLETDIDMQKAIKWLQTENEQRPVQKRLLAAVLLLKASALALQKVRELNGYWENNRLQIKEGIHIGFAISLRGGGLVIPAIHDVDKKSVAELMENLTDVSERAKTGKLRSSELTDGTITITNIGDRGVAKVFGVIYPPQVAIIGFGKIMDKPWAEDGMLGIRPVLTATLAADHRATDGRIGAKFLSTLNKLLQKPAEL